MMPNPIVLRSAERRGGSRVLTLEETVAQETIVRSLELDELTFEGVQRAFHTHPFRRNDRSHLRKQAVASGFGGILLLNSKSRL